MAQQCRRVVAPGNQRLTGRVTVRLANGSIILTDHTTHDNGKKVEQELSDIRVRRDSPAVGARDAFTELKDQLCRQILARREPALAVGDRAAIRPFVHEHLGELLAERGIVLNRGEKRQLLEAVVAELSNSLP